MKAQALAIIIALASGLLLLIGTAEARATKTEYTGTQTCGATSPGEVTYPDGNIHIKGSTSTCNSVTTLPDGSSVAYTVGNANLDSTGSGPVWGTIRIETTGGAVLEGSYRGMITGGTSWIVNLVAQGLGDLNAKLFNTSECQTVSPGVSECDMRGTLLVP